MKSLLTQTEDGEPQMNWYLPDGTPAAVSVGLPPPSGLGLELWEHLSLEGELVGKTLRVETGYGHYTAEGDLIEETPRLEDFWQWCDLAPELAEDSDTASALESGDDRERDQKSGVTGPASGTASGRHLDSSATGTEFAEGKPLSSDLGGIPSSDADPLVPRVSLKSTKSSGSRTGLLDASSPAMGGADTGAEPALRRAPALVPLNLNATSSRRPRIGARLLAAAAALALAAALLLALLP